MPRKSTTWDPQVYFPSEGRRAEDFFFSPLNIPTASAGFVPAIRSGLLKKKKKIEFCPKSSRFKYRWRYGLSRISSLKTLYFLQETSFLFLLIEDIPLCFLIDTIPYNIFAWHNLYNISLVNRAFGLTSFGTDLDHRQAATITTFEQNLYERPDQRFLL
jgi:hypothetical protein